MISQVTNGAPSDGSLCSYAAVRGAHAASWIMRKLPLFVTVVSLAVMAVAVAITTPAWASAGPSVSGTGTLGQFGDPTVRVSAIAVTPVVLGSFVVTYPDGTAFAATGECVFVSGTTAYVTGRISRASGPRVVPDNFFLGNYVIIGIVDNGRAGPDLLNFSPGLAVNPGCGPNPAATPVFPIVKGNYLVKE